VQLLAGIFLLLGIGFVVYWLVAAIAFISQGIGLPK
jgi:hypothetical protein